VKSPVLNEHLRQRESNPTAGTKRCSSLGHQENSVRMSLMPKFETQANASHSTGGDQASDGCRQLGQIDGFDNMAVKPTSQDLYLVLNPAVSGKSN
jgi:hypothetical protein